MRQKLSKIVLINVAIMFCSSCEHKSKNVDMRPTNYTSITASSVLLNSEFLSDLKDKALKGDTSAYNELSSAYSDVGNYENLLSTSIVVANDYNNPQAMLDVYLCLSSYSSYNCSSISKTRYMALYFLSRSYESGYPLAKFEVSNNFGGYITSSGKYIDSFLIARN
jgi:hypothetical protein